MKRLNEVKEKWIYPTGAFFIAVLLVFFVFLKLSMPEGVVVLTVRDTFCLLGYSIGLTAAKFILHTDLGTVTRYVLHAAAALVDFIVFILLLTGHIGDRLFSAIVISIIYLIGYLIVMAVRGAILSAIKREENQKQTYKNRFSKSE